MTETLCISCCRPMPDQAYACTDCAYRAGDRLHDIADMTPAARDIATGMARHGSGGSSEAESRIPLNLGATQRLNAVQARLSTWVREIAEARNRPIPAPRHLGDDPIILWARWLAGHVDWIRKTVDAERFLIEVDECLRAMRSVACGKAEQRFLGPCGSTQCEMPAEDGCPVNCACHNGPHYACDEPGGCGSAGCGRTVIVDTEPCPGDVYCHLGAEFGRCKTCGAKWPTVERQAWLDGKVREHAFRASQIADAYGVNVDTIRSWAARGQLKSYWRTELGLTVEWVDPVLDDKLEGEELEKRLGEISDEIQARGGRLHYVGDVLDLAAAAAARRATEQAKRARRAAAKAAEEAAKAAESKGDAA